MKKLGPKLGPLMKEAKTLINNLSKEEVLMISQGNIIKTELDGNLIELNKDDIDLVYEPIKGMAVGIDGELVIGLETELTEDLISEGLAREFVNKIQMMRKELDFKVTQRIEIEYLSNVDVIQSIEKNLEYIKNETLALKCLFNEKLNKIDPKILNGNECFINIRPTP